MEKENKLPFLISIPHGGVQIPNELILNTQLTHEDILEDGDAFSIPIYNLEQTVQQVIDTPIARAFLDLNRSIDQLPPQFPDGIFKSHTCYLKPVFKNGQFPDESLRNKVLHKYYRYYHNQITKALKNELIQFGFDCHTMASESPPVSAHPGEKRPLVCLSNRNGATCTHKSIQLLRDIFINVMDCKTEDVKINDPFSGGYIIQTYGNNPIPWIQIELNRNLYLSSPWFNVENWTINIKRLNELNIVIKKVLEVFNQELQNKQ